MSEISRVAHLDNMFYLPADAFFPSQIPDALTFDDVSLKTQKSGVLPNSTDPTTFLSDKISLATPILSADMDTVTEARMAIAMALNGGIGIVHSNLTPEDQIKHVDHVKHHVHGIISDPISVDPSQSIGDLLEKVENKEYRFGTFPVVENGQLVGLISSNVLKERYKSKKVSEVMKKRDEILTLNENELGNDPIQTADAFFDSHVGNNKILVVDKNNALKGLITASDIDTIMKESQSSIKPTKDSNHRLRVGASLHMFRDTDGNLDKKRILEQVEKLVEKGLDVGLISSAHGHTIGIGEMVALVRDAFPELTLIAGNVTSAEGVEFLKNLGADTIKVGQGPGSICTTREVAGVGIPQMTALYVCSQAAKIVGARIIADGGISKSGDIVKALTLADAVMCGGVLAGAEESPGDIVEIDGKLYKMYRGMGTIEAMTDGSAARYGHSKDANRKLTAEGIKGAKELIGPLADILKGLRGGLQSGMGYLGAGILEELRQNARYIRTTGAGQKESQPHDIIQIKGVKK